MGQDMQRRAYMIVGILLAILGALIAMQDGDSDVVYKSVEGVSVFAVLYVIAQGAERVSEWAIDLLSLLSSSPEKQKQAALLEVRKANSTLNGNPSAADLAEGEVLTTEQKAEARKAEEEKVDEARTPITFLAHGLSFFICAIAVNELNYGLFSHIGAENVDVKVDHLLTALAAAGGTKALHELIGRMQKAKESAEKED